MRQFFVGDHRSALLSEALRGVQAEIGATVGEESRWEIGCPESMALRARIEVLLVEETILNGLLGRAHASARAGGTAARQPERRRRRPRRHRKHQLGASWDDGQQHPVAA